MICPDTNVIYHFLFETELTSASEKIIREAIVEGMAIPAIVYSELLYIVRQDC
ncbi:MAG TPA: PIN domain-containing protein [Pyrodictium sp.]|nr:PIN domain-containing protein [Pyrodictium sp.]